MEQFQEQDSKKDIHGIIPPYLLKELASRDPLNYDYLNTLKETSFLAAAPQAAIDDKDLMGNGEIEVYDAKRRRVLPGDPARFEGAPPYGLKSVDDAYEYTRQVKEFYKNEFGRDSLDGQGMKFVVTANFGINFENAFWNRQQITFGNPGPGSPFNTFVLLDITAHEITHGITERESHLEYHGQSGALNESISDVFGELVEQYQKRQRADQAEWVVGDGIFKDGLNGRGLRDMLNPGTAYDDPRLGKDPQPAHMKDYVYTWGDDDNGGVHYNSGIPNRAFALFARSLGGFAWELPGQIWFAARKAAGSNPDFRSFAKATLEEAARLAGAETVQKLQSAWEDVGVLPALAKSAAPENAAKT